MLSWPPPCRWTLAGSHERLHSSTKQGVSPTGKKTDLHRYQRFLILLKLASKLKLMVILLLQPPKGCNYRCVSLHPASNLYNTFQFYYLHLIHRMCPSFLLSEGKNNRSQVKVPFCTSAPIPTSWATHWSKFMVKCWPSPQCSLVYSNCHNTSKMKTLITLISWIKLFLLLFTMTEFQIQWGTKLVFTPVNYFLCHFDSLKICKTYS